MSRWIALFRGINVGGRNLLSMSELRAELEQQKFTKIRTYIQSGNVVFNSRARSAAALESRIRKCVKQAFGFQPHVLVLDADELESAVTGNPWPKKTQDPRTLHFFFLSQQADGADIDGMESVRAKTEAFHLTDSVFYLYAPDGIARSRLAANAEKYLGVPATARNYRTVCRIREMMAEG